MKWNPNHGNILFYRRRETKDKKAQGNDDKSSDESEDEDSSFWQAQKYQSRTLDSQAKELKQKEIRPVPILAEDNWSIYLHDKAKSLIRRSQNWRVNISPEVSDLLKEQFPAYRRKD